MQQQPNAINTAMRGYHIRTPGDRRLARALYRRLVIGPEGQARLNAVLASLRTGGVGR